MDKRKKHLPIMGAGPAIVGFMALTTAAGITLYSTGHLDSGSMPALEYTFLIGGCFLMQMGIAMLVAALTFSHMVRGIKQHQLITTGVYALVRNPLYSAFLAFFTGLLMMFSNAWLMAIPVMNWAAMSLILIHTEERWLKREFGKKYEHYRSQVNRCIPWFPKQG